MAKELFHGHIHLMRPTQAVVGWAEMHKKMTELRQLSHHHLDKYLQDHPIPAVIGPGLTLYLIDHHHLGLALTKMGLDKCWFQIAHDFSTVPADRFMAVMELLDLLYLKNEHGQPIHPSQLPASLVELRNDPFRSLAGFLRQMGWYMKVGVPFAEFIWANFLREQMASWNGIDFQSGLDEAKRLAQSPEAASLPGFLPWHP